MLAIFSFAAYTIMPKPVKWLEYELYDLSSKLADIKTLSDTAVFSPVIIEITSDKAEPEKISFEDTEKITEILSAKENAPAVMAFYAPIAISEPASENLTLIKNKYQELKNKKKIKETGNDFLQIINGLQAEDRTEKNLKKNLKGSKYVLPIKFNTGMLTGKLIEMPEWISKHSIKAEQGATLASAKEEGVSFIAQSGSFTAKAAGAGHINYFFERDGILRFETPFIAYGNKLYPSIALETARIMLGLSSEEIKFYPGKKIILGNKTVPLLSNSELPIKFISENIQTFSSKEILSGMLAPETFKDKIVIFASASQSKIRTANGLRPYFISIASALNTLMSDSFITRPAWTYNLELCLILAAGIFTAFVSLMPSWLFHALAATMFIAVFAGAAYMFCAYGIWIKASIPALALAEGYAFGIMKRFFVRYELKQNKIKYSSKPPPLPPVAMRQAYMKKNAVAKTVPAVKEAAGSNVIKKPYVSAETCAEHRK